MNDEYLTVAEVAVMLDVSEDTVRRMFASEPGVVNLGRGGVDGRRGYRVLRIPRRVLNRVIDSRVVREEASSPQSGSGNSVER